MPTFPESDGSPKDPKKSGAFKAATPHRFDDEKMVLEYHKRTHASTETRWALDVQNTFTETENTQYAISRFYLRKILHILNPTFFPDCYFSSDKALVVEKRTGTTYSWEQIPDADQQKIVLSLNQLGLPINFFDISASKNFFKAEGTFTYIDSVVNKGYFILRNLLMNIGTEKILENEEYLDTAHLMLLAHAYMTIESSGQAQEISQEKLDAFLKKEGLNPKQEDSIRKLFARYKANLAVFPNISKEEAGKALVRFGCLGLRISTT